MGVIDSQVQGSDRNLMAERVLLKGAGDSEFNEAVNTAVRYINAGEVIVVAAEFGYIYLADAFDKDAVKAVHILRGDQSGVAAQVFIKDVKVLTGIAKNSNINQDKLFAKFWPGLLSVTLNCQPGLSWDLGDGQRLGKVNVRVPNREFLNHILQSTGPLVAGSVALTGKSVVRDLAKLPIYESDVGAIFDEGVLDEGPASTWLEISENEITVERVGAISIEQLQAVIPSISASSL
jgi:tRNA threonylcarbamoyl adenosine modification protein (Sua5/YciO/YrdC/YwlC family)